MEKDCPDGFRVDEGVWNKLQELRKAKVLSERSVKSQTTAVNKMKQDAEALASEQQSLTNEINQLRSDVRLFEQKVADPLQRFSLMSRRGQRSRTAGSAGGQELGSPGAVEAGPERAPA
jgi:chromosome segregation ATPase